MIMSEKKLKDNSTVPPPQDVKMADPVSIVPTAPKSNIDAPASPSKKTQSPEKMSVESQSLPSAAGKKRKVKDMSRSEWAEYSGQQNDRNDAEKERKRLKALESKKQKSHYPQFSKEEIAEEDRRPKKKVAVMIGYSGAGYSGMQIIDGGKSIEGDLFSAFVSAGAISKANANDPKKSSLARCARTDKGVHAACNLISLKLIVEDADIVKKINEKLPDQIRVWGYVRTTNGFNCYQSCDSRMYEYLMPSYALLPPHPRSYLGTKIAEIAKDENDLENYRSRQGSEVDFWEKTDRESITPLLADLDETEREIILSIIHESFKPSGPPGQQLSSNGASAKQADSAEKAEDEADFEKIENVTGPGRKTQDPLENDESSRASHIRQIRASYIQAKKAYRVSPERLKLLRECLAQYNGTHKFHNYTIEKSIRDPSAKRLIKSFTASEPILIGDTEWISLKVHGQSFMMHQIRKMVAMVALIIRCGCPIERITESYEELISIPKFPSLGLLLERPLFENYNSNVAAKFEKEPITFTPFDKEIDEFKHREIYSQIFKVEDEKHQFHQWLSGIDSFKQNTYLYLTSGGFDVASRRHEREKHEKRGGKNEQDEDC